MRNPSLWLVVVLASGLGLSGCSQSGPQPTKESGVQDQSTPASAPLPERVPAFRAGERARNPLPVPLPAAYFKDYPDVARVYQAAARIPKVLEEQPCYCWCERSGHGGLLDCFVSEHGASCDICQQEVLLADMLTHAGASPAQVREAIIRGDWKTIRLDAPGR